MNESNDHDIAFANPTEAASSSLPEVMDESRLLITADQLLVHYRDTGSHSTFELLVKRYAPLVFSECISVTRNRHDAEDAAQAAFLTLAVHARGQTDIRKLGPWLQQVARRVALDQQKAKRRRTAREQKHHRVNGYDQVATPELEGLDNAELRAAIQEELQQIPAKYRMPLILHYFGGMSRDQMAKELSCKAATLGVRIFRAREMLGKRLKKRGISLTPLLLLAFLTEVIGSNITGGLAAKAGMIATAAELIHGGASSGVTSALIPEAARYLPVGSSGRIALRVKAMITSAVLAASAVAGGAEIVHKFATGEWVLPSFSGLKSLFDGGWSDSRNLPLDYERQLPGLTSHGVSDATSAWPGVSFPDTSKVDTSVPVLAPIVAPSPITVAAGTEVRRVKLPSLFTTPAHSSSMTLAKTPAPSAQPTVPTVKSAEIQNQFFAGSGPSGVSKDPLGSMSYGVSSGPSDRPATVSVGLGTIPGPGATVPLPIQIRPLTQADLAKILTTSIAANGAGTGESGSRTDASIASGGNPSSASGTSGTSSAGGSGIAGLSGSAASFAAGEGTSIGSSSDGSSGTSQIGTGGAVLATLGGAIGSSPANAGTTSSGSSPAVVGSTGSAAASAPTFQIASRLASPAVGFTAPGQSSPSTYVYSSLNTGSGVTVLKGFGTVPLNRALDQSGVVIATGYGHQRTLDLSGATAIKNTISNAPGSPNGWYALAGGRLELPRIPLAVGDNQVVWGDEAGPTAPDLVNSLVLSISAVKSPGQLAVSLLASDRAEVPTFPTGTSPCSIWQISSTADYGSLSITGRVTDMSGSLWSYDGQGWSRVATTFDPGRMIFSATLMSSSHLIALLDGGMSTTGDVSLSTVRRPMYAQTGSADPLAAADKKTSLGRQGSGSASQTSGSPSGIAASMAASIIGTPLTVGQGQTDLSSLSVADGVANVPHRLVFGVGPLDPIPSGGGALIPLGTSAAAGGDIIGNVAINGASGNTDVGLGDLSSGLSSGGSSSVPEPGITMLVAAGLGVLLRRSRASR